MPVEGRALDLAGGAGRHAVWLAERGLYVTLTDISDVAIAKARQRAERAGVEITAEERDLEAAGPPSGEWDVVVIIHYLDRDLLSRCDELLAPGGLLVFAQPTERNLERFERPGRRFLLEEGELAGLLPPSLEVVRLDEGWLEDGRHEARVVARRPVGLTRG